MGMHKRPDNEVSKMALYYREYRKNGPAGSKSHFSKLTKKMLEDLNVSVETLPNGQPVIIQGNTVKTPQLVTQHFKNGNKLSYYNVSLFDAAAYYNTQTGYHSLSPEEKKKCGNRYNKCYGVAKVYYAWVHGEVPKGMTIDHINNDSLDNRIENLQLLTPGANASKAREQGFANGYGYNQYIKSEEDVEKYKQRREAKEKARVEAQSKRLESQINKQIDKFKKQYNLYATRINKAVSELIRANKMHGKNHVFESIATKQREIIEKNQKRLEIAKAKLISLGYNFS